jgi:hypothetical protein
MLNVSVIINSYIFIMYFLIHIVMAVDYRW